MAELNPLDYTVAWIAPLEIEAQVALHLLDKRHQGRFPLRRGDDYIFQAGEVCGHNVVVATLPAGQEYGVGSAAALASQVKAFFPNLWFGLLVGVAAGLPNLKRTPAIDIRLGDVLVALGDGDSAGLVAYDLGKETSEGMKLLQGGHVLAATEPVIRSAIGSIKMNAPNDAEILKPYYESIKDREHTRGTFEDPGQQRDNLYEFDEYGMRPVSRWPRPESKRTRVWYGPIGSGDKLLKDARKRNELRDKYNIIGLEMEAAGTMNRIPVGVIRGVCDYGDAFKNKHWQPYAAAMAGAYAKAVLAEIRPRHAQDAEAAAKQLDEMKLTTAAAAETIVLLPFGRDPCFVGRESELKQLGDMLETDADAHSFVEGAIVGLGGIGKTQIANEFAHRLREKDSGRPIIWLHASSQARLEHDFNVLARQLNPRTEYGSQTEIFTMVKEWLEAEASGRWLLIIDNADEEDVFFQPIKSKPQPPAVLTRHAPRTTPVSRLSEFLPTKANCAVLYTSRHMICVQKLLQRTRSTKIMEIPTLSVDDSVRMLRLELYGSQEDPNQTELSTETTSEDDASVMSLVELLGCLPLAITQAASFMRENGLAPNEYAALYSDAEMDHAEFLEEEFIDWRRDSDTPNAVLMTWKLSFEQIKSKNKVAVQVLSVFSALDSHGVPDWMLPYLPGIARFQIIKAIAILRSFSFISRRGNSMHRLVQVATRAWIGPEMWQAAVQDALRFLCNVFAGLNSNEWVGDSELKYSTLRKSLDYYPHTKSVLRALSTVTPLESISGGKDQSGSIAKSTMDSFLAEWDTGHLRSDEFGQKASEIYQEIITGGYQSLNDMIFFVKGLSEGSSRYFYHLYRGPYEPTDSLESSSSSPSRDIEDHEYDHVALSAAAQYGDEGLVKLLLDMGKVDVDSMDSINGRTPLSRACEFGHEKIVEMLLKTGKVRVNSKDCATGSGRTPLLWATIKGHTAVVKLLLDTGHASINATDYYYGRTPLSWAAGEGHLAILELLLACDDVVIDKQDSFNRETALSWAAKGGHSAAVKALLDTGNASINALSNGGNSPLSYAAEHGHASVVKMLLDTGKADVAGLPGYGGWTVLVNTARKGHTAVVALLLETGEVDVNARTERFGLTALSWAMKEGHTETVELLRAWGAVE